MTILLVLKVKENYAFKINLKAWWCDVVCLVFGSEREREGGGIVVVNLLNCAG